MTIKTTKTYIPSLRGQMGDWTYYTGCMPLSDIAAYVGFASEVCPNEELDRMIQREVGDRAAGIATYLSTNAQRFFGSLIIAAYDGKPRFFPVSVEAPHLLEKPEERMGLLVFDGTEKYYALDGQHRLWAIKEEVKANPERYKEDQVSVVVICHNSDEEGMSRARRLFTTLNRYAKPTAKATDIAMDEDDGYSILTRRLIREHSFFKHRIKVLARKKTAIPTLAKGDAMNKGDAQYLMSLGTFRKCNERLMPVTLRPAFGKPQQTPSYDELEQGYIELKRRWDLLISVIPLWESFAVDENRPGVHRTEEGGPVLVRPVAIASLAAAAATGFEQNLNFQSRMPKVLAAHSQLTDAPWSGVIWNATDKKMIAGHDPETHAESLWRYLLGLDVDVAQLEMKWKSRVDPANARANLHLPPRP